jgi:hypothetical protein
MQTQHGERGTMPMRTRVIINRLVGLVVEIGQKSS